MSFSVSLEDLERDFSQSLAYMQFKNGQLSPRQSKLAEARQRSLARTEATAIRNAGEDGASRFQNYDFNLLDSIRIF